MLTTPDGTRFAIRGEQPTSPAPTLFVFGGDRHSSLVSEDVNRLGQLLAEQGFISVSLDIPCHGEDARPGEEAGSMTGWRDRIVNGEDIVAPFTAQVSRVLDFLIAENYTDPETIVVSGTSRGGFFALHAAAADERIRFVIGFAPVTHLPVLAEFEGAREHPAVLALSPIHVADKLAKKSIWLMIGNHDDRVGTDECLALTREIIAQAEDQVLPIPVELHLTGTIGHRLHARAAPTYQQFHSPHDEAAAWLLPRLPAE